MDITRQATSRPTPLLALALIAPAPSIGILVAFYANQGVLGTILWAAAKLWLFGLPLAWYLWIERGRLSLSPARHGGLAAGFISGLAIFAGIIGVYWLIGRHWIDPQLLRDKIEPLGLMNRTTYLIGAAYWILINSVLEEYVYRWFIFGQCERLMPAPLAVIASAGIFVIHHALALATYFDWRVTTLCSLGIFIGGAAWSALYLRYRSIWPCYISHAWADIAVFGLGWFIIFGDV